MSEPYIPININNLSEKLIDLIQYNERLVVMLRCKNEDLEIVQNKIIQDLAKDFEENLKYEIIDAESAVPLAELHPEWKATINRTDPLFLFYGSQKLVTTYEGHNYDAVKREISKLLGNRQTHWMKNKAHVQMCRSTAFLSGDTLCSGGQDGLLKIWSFASDQLKELFCWSDHVPSNIASIATYNGYLWSSDFRGVAIRHCIDQPAEEVIRLIDPSCIVEEGRENTSFAHLKTLSTIKVTPKLFDYDCPCVLTGGWDGSMKVWNHDTGHLIQVYPNHQYAVTMEVLRGGEYLVSGCQSGILKLWDSTGLVHELKAHDDIIREIVAIDDSTIVTSSNDAFVKVFRLKEGRLIQDETQGFECTGFVYSIAPFNHPKHGTVIATACEGGLFTVRPLKINESTDPVLGEIDFSKATPRCIRVSEDGQFLAVANDGGLLSVWDTENLIGGDIVPSGEQDIQNATKGVPATDTVPVPAADHQKSSPSSIFPILDHQKYDNLNSLIKINELPSHWDAVRTKALDDTERLSITDMKELVSDIEKKEVTFDKLDVLRGVIWSHRGDLVRILEDNMEMHVLLCESLVNILYSSEEFDIKVRIMAMRCIINLFSIKSADVERTAFLKFVNKLISPPPQLYTSKLLYTTMSALLFNITVSSMGCSGCSTHSRRGVIVEIINNMMAYSKAMGYPVFAETNLLYAVGNFVNSKAYGIEEFGNLDDLLDEQKILVQVRMK